MFTPMFAFVAWFMSLFRTNIHTNRHTDNSSVMHKMSDVIHTGEDLNNTSAISAVFIKFVWISEFGSDSAVVGSS